MDKSIKSLEDDPELLVCAWNDGGWSDDFPTKWDLDDNRIKMPQDTLRTDSKGWTRCGICTDNENTGIWLQTYV